MWFSILKEDGDELWNNRTRHYFVKALEGIFDEVETNFAAANNSKYDHHVITIKHKWGDSEKLIIKIAAHDIRFQDTGMFDEVEWGWLKEFPYENYTELLDKLKAIDGKLTIPTEKHLGVKETIEEVMKG